MYRRGMVYKGRKPVHWCYHCKTALAEAEIEYGDEITDSIYVKFRFTEKPAPWADQPGDAFVVIWTTTPWTLPANVAVTLAPDADYVAVAANGELLRSRRGARRAGRRGRRMARTTSSWARR